MKVKDLQKILADLDPDMPVITTRCSDYMDQDEPYVLEVIKLAGRWIEWHPEQWKRRIFDFASVPLSHRRPVVHKALHFRGN